MSTARLEMRVPREIKELAEKSIALTGSSSLTEFVIQAIREKASRVISEQNAIVLSAEGFDRFMVACEKAAVPSKELRKAARRFDDQGYK